MSGLNEGQLYEDSLPSYDTLDTTIDMFVSQECSIKGICETGSEREIVTRVVSMIKRNEYKRRQEAIGFVLVIVLIEMIDATP